MDPKDVELVGDVAAEVRAVLQAVAPAWRLALVRFELLDGCFSTRVLHGAAGALEPLDAVRHRSLFVRLQGTGRQLCAAAGPSGGRCEVEIDWGGQRATRSAATA